MHSPGTKSSAEITWRMITTICRYNTSPKRFRDHMTSFLPKAWDQHFFRNSSPTSWKKWYHMIMKSSYFKSETLYYASRQEARAQLFLQSCCIAPYTYTVIRKHEYFHEHLNPFLKTKHGFAIFLLKMAVRFFQKRIHMIIKSVWLQNGSTVLESESGVRSWNSVQSCRIALDTCTVLRECKIFHDQMTPLFSRNGGSIF